MTRIYLSKGIALRSTDIAHRADGPFAVVKKETSLDEVLGKNTTIVITSERGGAGKTTLTNLISRLVALFCENEDTAAGKEKIRKVLYVDFDDPQKNRWMVGLSERRNPENMHNLDQWVEEFIEFDAGRGPKPLLWDKSKHKQQIIEPIAHKGPRQNAPTNFYYLRGICKPEYQFLFSRIVPDLKKDPLRRKIYDEFLDQMRVVSGEFEYMFFDTPAGSNTEISAFISEFATLNFIVTNTDANVMDGSLKDFLSKLFNNPKINLGYQVDETVLLSRFHLIINFLGESRQAQSYTIPVGSDGESKRIEFANNTEVSQHLWQMFKELLVKAAKKQKLSPNAPQTMMRSSKQSIEFCKGLTDFLQRSKAAHGGAFPLHSDFKSSLGPVMKQAEQIARSILDVRGILSTDPDSEAVRQSWLKKAHEQWNKFAGFNEY